MSDHAAELRALMRLTEESTTGAGLVLNALLEATLKQREGTDLGSVEIPEGGLLDFLDLLTSQTAIELRVHERAVGDHPAGMLMEAFNEIVRDKTTLLDPDALGYASAAIYADLTRESTGSFCVNVGLTQIDGAQLAFVLDVARRYELEAREERGYLCLRPHLIPTEEDALEPDPEAVEA